MMLALQRQQEALKVLKSDGSTRVTDLARMFDVTEETIRRDLDKLEAEGKVIRSHGGAMPVSQYEPEAPHWQREQINKDEKEAIGREAVKRVQRGDRILLDASSTAWYLAKELPDMELTVVTNAIHVAVALAEHHLVRVVFLGGRLSRASMSFQGAMAQQALSQYQVDKLFLSGQAFSLDNGLSDDNEQHAMLKRDMIARASACYLMLDYSKFQKHALTQIADITQFSELITDDKTDKASLRSIGERGVKVTAVTVA